MNAFCTFSNAVGSAVYCLSVFSKGSHGVFSFRRFDFGRLEPPMERLRGLEPKGTYDQIPDLSELTLDDI